MTVDQATAVAATSTDGTRMLVGGWLRGGILFCPNATSRWQPCVAMHLLTSPSSQHAMTIYPGAATAPTIPRLAPGKTVAVVVRAHTHDPGCDASIPNCLFLPVLDEVVWSAELSSPTLVPDEAPPAGGISQAAAVSSASAFVALHGGSDTTVVEATLARYGDLGVGGAPVSVDRWVWAIRLGGTFAPSCDRTAQQNEPCTTVSTALLLVDYLADGVLMAEFPAPSSNP